MKKSIFIFLIFCSATLNAQVQKPYRYAIGGRLGFHNSTDVLSPYNFIGASYKNLFSRRSAFEASPGFSKSRYDGFVVSIALDYQFHFPIGKTRLMPYVGAGGTFIYRTLAGRKPYYENYGTKKGYLFLYPVIGFDYTTQKMLNMAIEVKPAYLSRLTNFNGADAYFGLAIRRAFK